MVYSRLECDCCSYSANNLKKIVGNKYMPSTDINDCIPELQDAWIEILKSYTSKWPALTLTITCTHRTPEEQFILFKEGREQDYNGAWSIVDSSKVVTYIDGQKSLSAHNFYPARALDVVVTRIATGQQIWDESYYKDLILICESVEMESGGSWSGFKDWPHIQIPNFRQYNS